VLGLLGILGAFIYPDKRAAWLLLCSGIIGFPLAFFYTGLVFGGIVGWMLWTFPGVLLIVAGLIAWISPGRLESSLPLLSSDKEGTRRAGWVLYAALLILAMVLVVFIVMISGVLFSLQQEGGRPTEYDFIKDLEKKETDSILSLTRALNDTKATVRADAALALRGMGSHISLAQNRELAKGSLLRALNDKDESVRANAAWALGETADREAVAPQIQWLNDSGSSVRADRVVLVSLIQALNDSSPKVRASAAGALGSIDDISAADALNLSLYDDSSIVSENAAFALGVLKDPRAIDPLIQALGDNRSDVRQRAASALGEMGLSGTMTGRSEKKLQRLWESLEIQGP
jgi:HEAT repeat protein